MKLEIIKGVYLPVIYDLYDDSNSPDKEYSPFFKNKYLEWCFEEKFSVAVGLIGIYDKSPWEDNSKLKEYSLVEVNYLPQKRGQDQDYPFVHSFRELGRIPTTALENGIDNFLCFDINDPSIFPEDFEANTKIIKGRKKLL